jgi:predicted Rossmann fold nucleotide-binding protein DprA/Smf involved in DNA uptake
VIHVGFTGTRHGMTSTQASAVARELVAMWSDGAVFHHGDCAGADEHAHDIALAAGYRIVIHPSTHRLRAYCTGSAAVRPSYAPLVRNRHIAAESDVLVAAPLTDERKRHSGTWYTVDYAEKLGKPVVLVLPDGAVLR